MCTVFKLCQSLPFDVCRVVSCQSTCGKIFLTDQIHLDCQGWTIANMKTTPGPQSLRIDTEGPVSTNLVISRQRIKRSANVHASCVTNHVAQVDNHIVLQI
jgi:hypothetical protein